STRLDVLGEVPLTFMSRRPVAALVFVAALLGSCRRNPTRLDDVQKMAYGVKPAVVRVSAYATATFAYPASAIQTVAKELKSEGVEIEARALDPAAPQSVETGS